LSTSENSDRISNLRKFASRLFKDGELIEYRAKCADGGMRGFYFTDLQRLAEVVANLDSTERALVSYTCINPLKGRLIRERGLIVNPTDEQVNQIIASPPGKTASNDDIDILRWIFIDVDTVRAPHLAATDKAAFDKIQHECSTDEEKAASKAVAIKVLSYLRQEKGWPQGIICDSGNGWHLLFRMNLQNTPTNYQNHGDVLKALKAKFDCSVANIDSTVYNPARLTRAYGSTTRKGTNTPERPYRPNYQLESKEPVGDVTLDQILNIAVESPGLQRGGNDDLPELAKGFEPYDLIDHYVAQGAFAIDYEKEWNGNPILATDYCLFQGKKHSGDEFKSGFVLGDSFGYKCFSDDCDGLHLLDAIAELNKKFIPYDKPIFEMDRIAVTQTFNELLANGDVVAAEDGELAAKRAEDAKLDEVLTPTPKPVIPEPVEFVAEEAPVLDLPTEGVMASAEAQAPAPDALPAGVKASGALEILAEKINGLATHLLAVAFHHPEEVWQDGFMLFQKRFRVKLGFDKKWKKPEDGEAEQQALAMPISEVIHLLLEFTKANKRLPDKETFFHWLDVCTDPYVAKNIFKDEVKVWVSKLKDKPAATFDFTAVAFCDKLDLRAEIAAWAAALNHFLLKELDIIGARTTLRKHFNISTTQDSAFEQGTWQERTDAIYADFEKNISGVDDGRKFKLGFKAIDNSGMNIGLDGDHAICLCGPASNRKTTFMLSIAMNFAIQGKNVLFFAGEHQCMKVLKRLTLQLSHFFKSDIDIGVIPGLSKWEGLNRTATEEDLKKVKNLLLKLKSRELVPGFIEPQNIGAIARGEEDKLGALLAYAEATFPKYQWDAIIIDPLDAIMPAETGEKNGANNWKICSGIIDRLFDFSRNAFGGKQCMVLVSAQFKSDARREIEKIQEKNAGVENFDDELESILKRDGLIQYFTTIGQRFDLCLGVATRTKDGTEGLIVRGRDREGGIFNSCHFHVDPDTNYMTQKPTSYVKREPEQAAAAVATAQASMEAFDEL
jgi:hypothetical protein